MLTSTNNVELLGENLNERLDSVKVPPVDNTPLTELEDLNSFGNAKSTVLLVESGRETMLSINSRASDSFFETVVGEEPPPKNPPPPVEVGVGVGVGVGVAVVADSRSIDCVVAEVDAFAVVELVE